MRSVRPWTLLSVLPRLEQVALDKRDLHCRQLVPQRELLPASIDSCSLLHSQFPADYLALTSLQDTQPAQVLPALDSSLSLVAVPPSEPKPQPALCPVWLQTPPAYLPVPSKLSLLSLSVCLNNPPAYPCSGPDLSSGSQGLW